MRISLRKRETTEGYSLYIDYNTKEYRYEFLKLYLFDQKILGRKLTAQEKNANKETMIAAEAIVGQKMEQYRNGVLKLYGISVKKKRQEKFLDYFDKVMGERENTSSSNMGNWKSARKHLVAFIGDRKIDFSDIDHEFLEGFKSYLLGADIEESFPFETKIKYEISEDFPSSNYDIEEYGVDTSKWYGDSDDENLG